jgi:hypothetical protein
MNCDKVALDLEGQGSRGLSTNPSTCQSHAYTTETTLLEGVVLQDVCRHINFSSLDYLAVSTLILAGSMIAAAASVSALPAGGAHVAETGTRRSHSGAGVRNSANQFTSGAVMRLSGHPVPCSSRSLPVIRFRKP